MIQIAQVFNNNVALVDLGNDRQAVAKGLGISFQKKKGDSIQPDKIEKIFYLDTETSRENLYFLLKDIPIDVVTTTYEIIDLAQNKYHLKVLDYIYITLSDHIYGAFKRFKDGTYVDSMVPDFHKVYPTEYQVADEALDIIKDNLGIRFPESEVKNLALHFINALGESEAETQFGRENEESVASIVQETLKRHEIFRSNSSENYYDRFMIHLQYLVDRMRSSDANSTTILPQFAGNLRANYPKSYAIATEIFKEIKEKLYPEISDDELIYFIIHIQRLLMEMPMDDSKEIR